VKSLGKFPDPFLGEIHSQPEALRRALAGLADQREALDRIAELPRGDTVILTGMGGSYAACYPLAADLANAGVKAVMLGAAELLHFRAGMVGPATPIVVISQSGESAEIVRLADELRGRPRRPPLVAVTNGRTSTLARRADVVLDTNAGHEVGPSTLTFAAGLVTLAAVGRVLVGSGADAVPSELSRAVEDAALAVERLLADGTLGDDLIEWLGRRDEVVILGRGPARAAAEMAALTLKEAVGLPAEALESAQFRHGPLELAGPRFAAVVIATEPETVHLDTALAQELRQMGAAVLEVSRGGEAGVRRDPQLHVHIGEIERSIASAVSIVPVQLLAHRLAIADGREPGTYLRAAKVTTRE
jgi:glutamine---fructose-6-phosphate transaminase (isomerizing)